MPLPDLLLEQIVTVGKPCEKRLLELLKNEESTDEARMTAIELLKEMGSLLPKMLYINWQMDRDDKDDLRDKALESLIEMGDSVIQPILQVLGKANEAGQEALLEVLVHFPAGEQTVKLARKLFRERKERRAVLAGYLARLGDDRVLPDLLEAAQEEQLPYLTYIEIRNAIEELGGECPEREYEDDPEYDALRSLQD